MDDQIIQHPSFGMIGWNRVSGRNQNLFGTSIEHNSFVNLEIREGMVRRNLNRDWYAGSNPIISVSLSPNQFSDFITSPNIGDGVPCTIHYIKGIGQIAGKTIPMKRKQFENEFKGNLQNIGENFEELNKAVEELSVSQKQKDLIKAKIYEVSRIINDKIPFIQKSFNEQLDNSVTEAKASVEAFTENKIRQFGLDAIKSPNFKLLLGDNKDED
jgi:hypothetical protein